MTTAPVPLRSRTLSASLTATPFAAMAEISPELDWLAHLTKPDRWQDDRQATQDVQPSAHSSRPDQFLDAPSAYVMTWRQPLIHQGLTTNTIRRNRTTLSSLLADRFEPHAV